MNSKNKKRAEGTGSKMGLTIAAMFQIALIIAVQCVFTLATPLGKYVREASSQSDLNIARKNETRRPEYNRTSLNLPGGRQRQMISVSNNEHDLKTELQIELVAAVIIASLFAIFFVVYVVCLQCWWKCKQRKPDVTSSGCPCLCISDLEDKAR